MEFLALLNDDEGDLDDMVCDRLGGMLISQEDLLFMDRRQGEAIKELLMAFDLPMEVGCAAQMMMLGAFFNPGATVGTMAGANRRLCLERARSLIDDLLKEV